MSCGRLSSILTVVNVSIFHFFSWCDSNCNPSIISRMCQTYFESIFSSIQFCCDNSTFCIVETTSINVVVAFWSRAVRIIKCWNLDFRATSMLVTDSGDKICGWQNLDIDNCVQGLFSDLGLWVLNLTRVSRYPGYSTSWPQCATLYKISNMKYLNFIFWSVFSDVRSDWTESSSEGPCLRVLSWHPGQV